MILGQSTIEIVPFSGSYTARSFTYMAWSFTYMAWSYTCSTLATVYRHTSLAR